VAGHLLAVHAEVAAAVDDQRVDLRKRTGVEQQLDPLACGELAVAVLALDTLGPATGARRREARPQLVGAARLWPVLTHVVSTSPAGTAGDPTVRRLRTMPGDAREEAGMPFCPQCRSEFRPGFDRCSDC